MNQSERAALRIAEFPDGSDIWRIDWFGDVAFKNRLLLRKHPSVLVHLSKVVAPNALNYPSVLLERSSTTPPEQQRHIALSIGKLMLLRIGDLWSNRRLIASPSYQEVEFKDICVSKDTTCLVKSGVSRDDGSFMLPLSEHPWHRHSTHSYCLQVTLASGDSLVIPCMELIRFYFGSSSELLHTLFSPPLTKDRLFNTCVLNSYSGSMSLELSASVHSRSAADVARIAGDNVAWRAARLVGASCLKASSAQERIYPQAIFPFEGKTDLTVSGKWIPDGGRSNKTFLVYQIRSCSHPFPFERLRHTSGKDKTHAQSSENSLDSAARASRGKASISSDPLLLERDGSSTLSGLTRKINAQRRFPDLERKPIIGSKPLPIPSGSVAAFGPAIPEEAIGEAAGQSSCRPISLVDVADIFGPPPEFLRLAHSALGFFNDPGTELLTCSNEDGWTIPIPLVADSDGVIDQKCFSDDSTSLRPRRLAAYLNNKKTMFAAIIEDMPFKGLTYPIDDKVNPDTWEFIHRAATDFCNELTTAENL